MGLAGVWPFEKGYPWCCCGEKAQLERMQKRRWEQTAHLTQATRRRGIKKILEAVMAYA